MSGRVVLLNGTSSSGKSTIADHVLSQRWRLDDLLDALTPYDVVFVGVRCDPEELGRREALRGDRPAGLAVSQLAAVHGHGLYDVEVDTGRAAASDCAEAIAERVLAGPGRSFPTLREERDGHRG